MRLLMHICCAPCACYPFRKLSGEGLEVEGMFYNPNIHPYLEWNRRLSTVQKWARLAGAKVYYEGFYGLKEFLRQVVFREEERCRYCYRIRLRAVAGYAARGGFSAYSTTLLYSIYQKHALIKEIGEKVGEREGIKFFYRDFRSGFREGVRLSKTWDLYRQPYCGCIYSEQERYQTSRKPGWEKG